MNDYYKTFNINLIKKGQNKIIINVENLKIDFHIIISNIIKLITEFYPEIKIEFNDYNEKKNNKNFQIILTINKNDIHNEIINPDNNHLYFLDNYTTEITNNLFVKYNVIGLSIVGLLIKEILYTKYNITIYTHQNSFGNIYDKVVNYTILIDELYIFKNDKLPIIDPRAKILMQKLINKSINDKKVISGSLETIIYNLPKNLGNPYYNLFESNLSRLLYLIPNLKSLEFANVYKINNNYIQPYKNIYFNNDTLIYDSNVYYGVEQGITTSDIVSFNTHFIPPLAYTNKSASINYKTLENILIEPLNQNYFILYKYIFQVEALSAIAIYDMILKK